jgi:hypothetical protein
VQRAAILSYNAGGFLMLPLKCGKSGASCVPIIPTVELLSLLATLANRGGEHIQPIRNKEKVKN